MVIKKINLTGMSCSHCVRAVEAVLEGDLVVTRHEDRPGVLAAISAAFSGAGLNIARLHLGPVGDSGAAMAIIGLDGPADEKTLAAVAAIDVVSAVYSLAL